MILPKFQAVRSPYLAAEETVSWRWAKVRSAVGCLPTKLQRGTSRVRPMDAGAGAKSALKALQRVEPAQIVEKPTSDAFTRTRRASAQTKDLIIP
jgi:hypothetical protein